MLHAARLRCSFLAFAVGLGASGVACAPGGGDTSGTTGSFGEGGDASDGGGSPAQTASTSTASSSSPSSSSGDGAGGDAVTTTSTTSAGDGGGGAGGFGGAGGEGTGGGEPECEVPENCPDPSNFCIARTCDDGVCGERFVDLGTPLPNVDQTQGNCSIAVCDGGGTAIAQDDDQDFIADADPCTIERCEAGEPAVDPADLGVVCGEDLTCDGAGRCVGCIAPEDCPGVDDECRTRVCDDDGQCAPTFADAGTVVEAGQTLGDCQELQCDGAGNIISTDSDGDVPPQEEDCVGKICTEGEPAETPIGPGASCDEDGGVLCDGSGSCVECLTVAQCPGDTTCVTYACLSGACVPSYADAGTLVSDPEAGDCRSDQCDGSGNVAVDAVANGDLPVDGVQCTNDVCSSGTPSNPPVTINTACTQNGGNRCNGSGACVECTAAAQCGSGVCTSGVCVPAACNDGVRNGQETGTDCGGPTCSNCPNNQGCGSDDDCISGFCNPSTLVCRAPTCSDGYANANETDVDCGGGTCADCGLGSDCEINGDCTSNYCFNGVCSTFFCGDGTTNPGEQCDDNNMTDLDGCDSDCVWTCGNGDLNTAQGELCEDGDHASNDGCSATCAIEANYQCTIGPPSVCTRQEVRCNNGLNDDGDASVADSSDADCAWQNAGQLPACAAGQTLYLYKSVRVPQAIPDVATITNDIYVPSIGTVRRVMIRLNITHTWDADLDIALTSPAGTQRAVAEDVGSSGDNFTNTRLRTGAATAIASGTAPFTGEYAPLGDFNGFNGSAALGRWRLTITDDAGSDTGTLTGYELAICAN